MLTGCGAIGNALNESDAVKRVLASVEVLEADLSRAVLVFDRTVRSCWDPGLSFFGSDDLNAFQRDVIDPFA